MKTQAQALVAMALLTQALPSAAAAAQDPAGEPRVVTVRVHGNHTTPDADVLAIAAVRIGDPVTPTLVAEVTDRLERSGRFRGVEVRQRYASLTDLSAVLLVIVIEERIGIAIDVPEPNPLRRFRASTMWLPVLRYEDGYGFTYGARFAFVDLLGARTRVGVPLTWGGERRAALEIERQFDAGPLTRLIGTGGVWRREHPGTDQHDRRAGGTLRAERTLASWLLAAGTLGLEDVRYDGDPETLGTIGGEWTVDTRHDPLFPRNAVYANLAVERLWFDRAPDATRMRLDARGYAGFPGSAVLAVRGQWQTSNEALPVFEQALLGGSDSLRGFSLGYRYGDRLAAASAEIRLPLTSPLKVGRFGVAMFVDTGAVYSATESLSQARFDTGLGAGLFIQAPLVSFRLDIAHGLDNRTRAHVGLGVSF